MTEYERSVVITYVTVPEYKLLSKNVTSAMNSCSIVMRSI